jgi:hypothetical protein
MHPEIYYEFFHSMSSKCGVVCKVKMEKSRAYIVICYVYGLILNYFIYLVSILEL